VGDWGRPLLPENFGQTGPVGVKTPIFNRYSLVAVTLSEKVQLTLIGRPS